MVAKRTWRKNLYENTGFPDNYTDETFLKDLKINIEVPDLTIIKCITGATVVVQELCAVILFVLVFVYLFNQWTDPNTIFSYTSSLTFIGFLYYRLAHGHNLKTTVRQDIQTILIYLVFGQIFSPVLHTLTDTISTDTIYTMTALMMFTHLVFFDYGLTAAIVSNSLSLSAAMFGSICLASRLASPYHAFVLMTVAIEVFVLFPVVRAKFKSTVLLAFILTLITLYVLYNVSFTMTILLTLTLIFISFIFPIVFLRWQKYKNNIYGPWDEAVVDDVDDINQINTK